MIDKIEMSLDDIIKSNKQSQTKKRGGGSGFQQRRTPQNNRVGGGIQKGRARGGITRSKYTRGDVNSAWKHDMFEGGRKGGIRPQGSTKLVVSNLDFGVSDCDINELFAEFGPLKAASVHYDRSGRSLGTADIVFERRNDALKAMKQYNGVPLDGRPMSIAMATSEVPAARAQVQRTPSFGGSNRSAGPRGSPRGPARGQRRGFGNRSGGASGSGAAGAGTSGGGGGNRRGPKPAITIEELDAELDAYTLQN